MVTRNRIRVAGAITRLKMQFLFNLFKYLNERKLRPNLTPYEMNRMPRKPHVRRQEGKGKTYRERTTNAITAVLSTPIRWSARRKFAARSTPTTRTRIFQPTDI